MPFPAIPIPAPSAGTFLDDADPEAIPREGAIRLENIWVDNGLARSRDGFANFLNTPNTDRVIDIPNLEFADRSVEAIRASKATSFRADYGVNPNVWAQINQAAATPVVWTGTNDDRFWAVVAPWTGEPKGRIVIGNGVDVVKSWTGTTGFMTAIAGATSARYGTVGPDGRLFVAYTVEGGTVRAQRVRWTIIGDASDWAGTGSGFLDIRAASWPITAIWLQHGRIFVGFSRAVAILDPTGIPTDAYGVSILLRDGTGVAAPHSLILYDNIAAFLAPAGFVAFNGTTADSISPHLNKRLLERLSFSALNQVTSYHDEARSRVGWGLPLDGATTPTEIWWYHYRENRWEIDTAPHTALAAITATDITSYDEWTGTTFDARSPIVYDSLSSQAALRPTFVRGLASGATEQRSSATNSDNGVTIPNVYVSGTVPIIGSQKTVPGQPLARRTIGPQDFIIADRIEIDLLDRGSNYTLKIEVSGDGGMTWTEMGQVTMTSSAPESARRRETKFVSGRIPMKDRVQVRVTNVTPGARFGWSRLAFTPDVLGMKL